LETFLRWLGGPALFHLRGRDSSRVRFVSGGLHGNEPSGFHAVHALLRDPSDLATDTVLLLGNVQAALLEPRFSNRVLPGGQDMNRVWGDDDPTPLGAVARQVLEELAPLEIEAGADLHNNTGYNPVYAISICDGAVRRPLARAWTRKLVLYPGTYMGTLLEQIEARAPGVVVECGQAGDPEADRVAEAGLRRFLTAEDVEQIETGEPGPPQTFRSLGRVVVRPEVSLGFGSEAGTALRVIHAIDRWNFVELPPGTLLGRFDGEPPLVLEGGRLDVGAILAQEGGEIRTLRPIVPVMLTTNPEVAKLDCLFYVSERLEV